MTASPGVNLTVSPELVQPIIREQIHAAIAAQMKNIPGLIEGVAAAALNVKVNNDGKVSDQDYYNKMPFVEWASRNMIHKAATAALETWLASHEKELQVAVEAHLKKNVKTVAGAIVASLVDNAKHRFNIKVSIEPPSPQ